ncbi:MAG: HAD-IC family P-type ATPase [bacterium]|nr:HAD-IC family P-type ATPase [bacterium]
MARIEQWGKKISSYAIPIGIIAAAFIFFYWYVIAASFFDAFWRSITVLIVTYPFILKYAAPYFLAAGIERARRAGIIFKDKASLEDLDRANVIVFNKSGTLTVGLPEITDFVVFDDTLPLIEALHLAASLESKSAHPLARAIVEKGKTLARGLATPFEYKEVAGMGVSGVVNGKHIEIGNLSFLEGLAEGGLRGQQDIGFGKFQNEGKTVVFMFVEKKLTALIAFSDAFRPFAKEAVAALATLGKEVVLLTGDNKKTAEAIARQLNITTVRAEVFPQDRARIIEELQGVVAVVEKNEIRMGMNIVMFASDDIRSVVFAFANSKRTTRAVKFAIIGQFLWYVIAFGALILFRV